MIRVGIGGWTYAPWRETFYPAGLAHAKELAFASSKLTAIEINGTFYRTQSATSYAKWHDETPDDFMFSIKGHRSIVNRSKLGEGKDAIDWFFASGLMELGPKLGPILWQMAPFKRFDADDIAAFFALLPREIEGRKILHAFEARHQSFQDEKFVTLAREAGVAIVKADSVKYPTIDDLAGGFVYARLQNASAEETTGYSDAELDQWARICRNWEAGLPIPAAPLLAAAEPPREHPVFAFMINGAKERAPAAAMALIDRLTPA